MAKVIAHLDLPTTLPQSAPARAPPWIEEALDQGKHKPAFAQWRLIALLISPAPIGQGWAKRGASCADGLHEALQALGVLGLTGLLFLVGLRALALAPTEARAPQLAWEEDVEGRPLPGRRPHHRRYTSTLFEPLGDGQAAASVHQGRVADIAGPV